MKPTENHKEVSRLIMKGLIVKATDSNMIQFNDALNFPDFINALWRLFLKHDNFCEGAQSILDHISQEEALQLLATEINHSRVSRN